mmetsp:Transcript_103796/g.206327  ORF Transcript_103796/g.206327 Transcript_103796/m.206327 type:complete len:105 (+) Transcript_103796:176-490(+)
MVKMPIKHDWISRSTCWEGHGPKPTNARGRLSLQLQPAVVQKRDVNRGLNLPALGAAACCLLLLLLLDAGAAAVAARAWTAQVQLDLDFLFKGSALSSLGECSV